MIDWLGWLILLQAILSLTGPVPVTSSPLSTGGRTVCYQYGPAILFGAGVDSSVQIHEYLHAYDCADNGVMDGSPLPSEYTGGPDVAHLWVYWAMGNPREAAKIVMAEP